MHRLAIVHNSTAFCLASTCFEDYERAKREMGRLIRSLRDKSDDADEYHEIVGGDVYVVVDIQDLRKNGVTIVIEKVEEGI